MAIFAAAGEGDGEIVGDIERGGLGIGHHRRVQEGLYDPGRIGVSPMVAQQRSRGRLA